MNSFWIAVLVCLATCVLFGVIAAFVYVMGVLRACGKS